MSNTVVKDITPAPNPGDNSLVIVVGEDGSLSVDPETLHSLISKYFKVFLLIFSTELLYDEDILYDAIFCR